MKDWRLAVDIVRWLLIQPVVLACRQAWTGLCLIVTAPKQCFGWLSRLEKLYWWRGNRYFRCMDCGRLCHTWATWAWRTAERIDGKSQTVGKCHRCDPPKRR